MECITHSFRRLRATPVAAFNVVVYKLLVAMAICLAVQPKAAQAQPCIGAGGWVVSVEGELTISGDLSQMGDDFCLGDEIVVGDRSRAAFRLAATQTVVRVDQNSTFVVDQSDKEEPLLRLLKGVLYLFSRRPQNFNVEAPYINAAIEGTEFIIESSTEKSEVTVIEGFVFVSNARGNVLVKQGETANVGIDGLPLRPRSP